MVTRLATTLIAFGLGVFVIARASTYSYDYETLRQFQRNLGAPGNKNNNNYAFKTLDYERGAPDKDRAPIRERSIAEEDAEEKGGKEAKSKGRQERRERKERRREAENSKVDDPEETTNVTNERQAKQDRFVKSTNENEAKEKTRLTEKLTKGQKKRKETTDPKKLKNDQLEVKRQKLSRNVRLGKITPNNSTVKSSRRKKRTKKVKKNLTSKSYRRMNEETLRTELQNTRWGMSSKGPPPGFAEEIQHSRRSIGRYENTTKTRERSNTVKNNRWGMSATSPPAEFLKDLSRRGFVREDHRSESTYPATRRTLENREWSKGDREDLDSSGRTTGEQKAEVPEPIERPHNFEGSVPSGSGSYNKDIRAGSSGFLAGTTRSVFVVSKSTGWKSSIEIPFPFYLALSLQANFPSGLSFPANVLHGGGVRLQDVAPKLPVICSYVSSRAESVVTCRFLDNTRYVFHVIDI